MCGPNLAGDFCDIAKKQEYASTVVVDFLSENDPQHLRADLAHNLYGRSACNW